MRSSRSLRLDALINNDGFQPGGQSLDPRDNQPRHDEADAGVIKDMFAYVL